jgi:hypothetical protein
MNKRQGEFSLVEILAESLLGRILLSVSQARQVRWFRITLPLQKQGSGSRRGSEKSDPGVGIVDRQTTDRHAEIRRPPTGPIDERAHPFLRGLSVLVTAKARKDLLPSTICRYSSTEGHCRPLVQCRSKPCLTNKLCISSMKMSTQRGFGSFGSSVVTRTYWNSAELTVWPSPKMTWVAGLPRRSRDPSCQSSNLAVTRQCKKPVS